MAKDAKQCGTLAKEISSEKTDAGAVGPPPEPLESI